MEVNWLVVKSLIDGNRDSPRWLLENRADPAKQNVMIFKVAGAHRSDSAAPFEITCDNLYIAGETAGYPGVFFLDRSIVVLDAENVTLSHLNCWPGNHFGRVEQRNGRTIAVQDYKPSELEDLDGIRIRATGSKPVTNIVVRHCSGMFATDETFSRWDHADATGQDVCETKWLDNVIAYGLANAGHPDGSHSKGMIMSPDTGRHEIRRNLFAHNTNRNPLMNPGTRVWLAENVFYNAGDGVASCSQLGVYKIAMQHNHHLVGPQSNESAWDKGKPYLIVDKQQAGSEVFAETNLGWHGLDHAKDIRWTSDEATYRVQGPPANTVDPAETLIPVDQVATQVPANAGPKYRHEAINELINDVMAAQLTGVGGGSRIDHQAEVGVDFETIGTSSPNSAPFYLPADPEQIDPQTGNPIWRDWLAEFEAGKDPAQISANVV